MLGKEAVPPGLTGAPAPRRELLRTSAGGALAGCCQKYAPMLPACWGGSYSWWACLHSILAALSQLLSGQPSQQPHPLNQRAEGHCSCLLSSFQASLRYISVLTADAADCP